MASRSELEAQIAVLKAILKEKEIDPEFTPKELVRWDPSLIGTILHMKHLISMPRTSFQSLIRNNGAWHGYINFTVGDFTNATRELKMEQICPLTHDGILVNKDVKCISATNSYELIYSIENTFQSMTHVPIRTTPDTTSSLPNQHPRGSTLVACDTLGIQFKNSTIGNTTQAFGTLPLCGPDDNILDHIYIASVVKLPFQDKEVVVDKYPLSVLYEEWKTDKAAGRTQRRA